MCRLLGWVSHSDLTLRGVLGEESFVEFAQLSRIHADGWGLAHVVGTDIEVRRSTTCAATDPDFHRVATEVASPAGLAHLRWASPGLPVELHNAHPFRHGRTAFAHNGLIRPFDRLSALLPEKWQARLTGTTDSEHYFLAVMAEIDRTGADVPTAVARVVRRLATEYTASSLNAMLLTPDELYVVNCHDASLRPLLAPADTGKVAGMTDEGMIEATEEEVPYFDLRYRHSGSSVVVASSGLAQPEGGGWQRIPNNTVLVVDRATLTVTPVPLEVGLGQSTAALQSLGADLR